jgi:hypothetical protein
MVRIQPHRQPDFGDLLEGKLFGRRLPCPFQLLSTDPQPDLSRAYGFGGIYEAESVDDGLDGEDTGEDEY